MVSTVFPMVSMVFPMVSIGIIAGMVSGTGSSQSVSIFGVSTVFSGLTTFEGLLQAWNRHSVTSDKKNVAIV